MKSSPDTTPHKPRVTQKASGPCVNYVSLADGQCWLPADYYSDSETLQTLFLDMISTTPFFDSDDEFLPAEGFSWILTTAIWWKDIRAHASLSPSDEEKDADPAWIRSFREGEGFSYFPDAATRGDLLAAWKDALGTLRTYREGLWPGLPPVLAGPGSTHREKYLRGLLNEEPEYVAAVDKLYSHPVCPSSQAILL